VDSALAPSTVRESSPARRMEPGQRDRSGQNVPRQSPRKSSQV